MNEELQKDEIQAIDENIERLEEELHQIESGATQIESFDNAWAGIWNTFLKERNFKIQLVAALLAVGGCIYLRVPPVEFILVLFVVFLVLCLELVNTALEAVVDLASGGKWHQLAKTSKDAAAAAVMLASFLAVAVAAAIFIPAIIERLLEQA